MLVVSERNLLLICLFVEKILIKKFMMCKLSHRFLIILGNILKFIYMN